MSALRRHFDAAFAEDLMLPPAPRRPGALASLHATEPETLRLRLRLIRPEDKAKMVAAFEALSPESRYFRFLAAKDRLTTRELRYLTEVDGDQHFALAAGRLDGAGEEVEGLAVARFVALEPGGHTAEPAITVVDHAQGRGLGRLLFLRLIAAARERGFRRFQSQVMVGNARMRHVLQGVAPALRERSEGDGSVAVVFDLPEVAPDAPLETPEARGPMYRVFSAAAGPDEAPTP